MIGFENYTGVPYKAPSRALRELEKRLPPNGFYEMDADVLGLLERGLGSVRSPNVQRASRIIAKFLDSYHCDKPIGIQLAPVANRFMDLVSLYTGEVGIHFDVKKAKERMFSSSKGTRMGIESEFEILAAEIQNRG